MRPAERTSTAVKPKTLLARHLHGFALLIFFCLRLKLLSLRSEVNILRIFGWLNRHLAIGQTGQLDWNLVIKNTMAHFDWRIFVKNTDWESDWLSPSWAEHTSEHTSWIVDGNYIYLNFSYTEAYISKMKTTALCVFALFLSPMLVECSIHNLPCLASGACNGEKVHE